LITNALRDIFRINLGVKKSERLLIFTDRISDKESISALEREKRINLASLSLIAAELSKAFCNSVTLDEYPATGSHGAEPPASLWASAFGEQTVGTLKKARLLHPILKKTAGEIDIKKAEDIIAKYSSKAVDCIVALSYFSTSHTRFRDFLTRICGCRYASMPLFDVSMLEGAMNVDWKSLAKRTIDMARIVNAAELIQIKTPNGTFLSFSKKGRRAIADTGILTRRGSFGNLPSGEVFLAPLEGTAQGKLVLEWAPTRQLSSPLTLEVQKGRVVDFYGADEYAGYLRMKLLEREENGNIAELGIGTNDAAKRPDNILESEKILGTIHVALGDNSSFGGKVKTPFHEDFVFFKPTLKLIYKDGSSRYILKAGNLLYYNDKK
jgi:aminopeptidase